MRVAIIGAGPTGLFLGAALARRGHRVTAVDRDRGPVDGEPWARKGVMQFHHAHAFRFQIADALEREVPGAVTRWETAGAEPTMMRFPDGSERRIAHLSQRQTFERALRETVASVPGLTLRCGHVDAVAAEDGHVTGLVVDGQHLAAELVIDASGRSGRVTRGLRETPTVGGSCGVAYVDRVYRLRPGAERGPMKSPVAWQADLDGYQVILFVHERGFFSVLIVRPTDGRDLAALRHDHVFEAACRAIPGLDTWTDPDRATPVDGVQVGGELKNWYRSQRGPDRHPALTGLVFVGDAVCTTTPMFGRGVTTGILQCTELLRLLDEGVDDWIDLTLAFEAWCDREMRPWVEDHVRMDRATTTRWAGRELDLSERLPSDLVLAAGEVEPAIAAATPPFLAMLAGPSCLDAVEPLAKKLYADGWRPALDDGPSRRELAEVVARAAG